MLTANGARRLGSDEKSLLVAPKRLSERDPRGALPAGKRTLDPRTGPLTLAFPTMHDSCGDGSP